MNTVQKHNVTKKRNLEEINISRGIAIVLVVVGHLVSGAFFINRWIFSFHMAFFFTISGFCYRESLANRSVPRYIFSRFLKLIIPSWIYVNLFHLIQMGSDAYFDIIRQNPLAFMFPEDEWFLPSLFFGSILLLLYAIIRVKCISTQTGKVVFSSLVFALAVYLGTYPKFVGFYYSFERFIFFDLNHSLVAFSYMLIGFVIRNDILGNWYQEGRSDLSENRRGLAAISVLAVIAGILFLNYTYSNTYVNICDKSYGDNLFLFYVVALYWTVILVIFSYALRNKKGIIVKTLSFWGKNSLWIYIGQGLMIAGEPFILGVVYNKVAAKIGIMTWDQMATSMHPLLCPLLYTVIILVVVSIVILIVQHFMHAIRPKETT